MRFAYTVFATFTIAAVLPASTITVGRPYADGTLDLNVDGTLVTVEITKTPRSNQGAPRELHDGRG